MRIEITVSPQFVVDTKQSKGLSRENVAIQYSCDVIISKLDNDEIP